MEQETESTLLHSQVLVNAHLQIKTEQEIIIGHTPDFTAIICGMKVS